MIPAFSILTRGADWQSIESYNDLENFYAYYEQKRKGPDGSIETLVYDAVRCRDLPREHQCLENDVNPTDKLGFDYRARLAPAKASKL